MQKPWVLIHNHLRNRDYNGSCNLAAHLENAGFEVSIISPYIRINGKKIHYIEFIPIAQPDIVIIPKTIDIKKLNHSLEKFPNYRPLIVCIPTEFGTYYENSKSKEIDRKQTSNGIDIGEINLLLSTTEDEIDRIKNNSINTEQTSFKVTGHPRLDFFAENYKILRPSKARTLSTFKISSNFQNKIITLATSFPYAIYYNNYECDKYKSLIDRLDKFNIYSPEIVKAVTKQHFIERQEMIDLLIELGINYPNLFFTMKVHPAEEFKFYQDLLGTLPRNTSIIQKGLSVDFISMSSMHIHTLCTTGIEAMLYNIPSVNFQPTKSVVPNKELIRRSSINTSSKKEVISVINKYLKHGSKYIESSELKINQSELIELAFGKLIGSSAYNCSLEIKKHYHKSRNSIQITHNNQKFYIAQIHRFNKWGNIYKIAPLTFIYIRFKQFIKLIYKKTSLLPPKVFYNPFTYSYLNYRKDINKIKNSLRPHK